MAATQTCIDFYRINSKELSKLEIMVMEGLLFNTVCHQLLSLLQKQSQAYFQLIHFYPDDEEQLMIQGQLIQFIIHDILATQQYTLPGIAYYTHTPLDTLFEIAAGTNLNPSLLLSQKLLALHRSLKPEWYRELLNKITYENLNYEE